MAQQGQKMPPRSDPTTFNGRIKGAMNTLGWEAKAMVLRSKWALKYGDKKTPERPTFYTWFSAQDPKISIPHLFLLGDLLQVNARWLALKSENLHKPFTPEGDFARFLGIYKDLRPETQKVLLREINREADKLLEVEQLGTQARPYDRVGRR